MSETLKYGIKKANKWIWLAIIAGFVCVGLLWVKGNNASVYTGDWETYPEAPRYVLYTSEIKTDAFNNDVFQESMMQYVNECNELIKQHILSISNQHQLYQLLIQKYPDIFPEYKYDKFMDEMIGMYWQDSSNLVVYTSAPKLHDESDYPKSRLCEMRDFIGGELVAIIENDEYIKSFPMQLKRAEKMEEDSLSEQLLLAEEFGESVGSSSVKKLIIVFLGVSILTYCFVVLLVLANGKIKTAEELELMTNLTVFNEFTRLEHDEAISIIRTKLTVIGSDKQVLLVTLNSQDMKEARTIAGEINSDLKVVQWNEKEGIIPELVNQKYILFIKQNRTRKSELAILAKELTQVNAECVGAILAV